MTDAHRLSRQWYDARGLDRRDVHKDLTNRAHLTIGDRALPYGKIDRPSISRETSPNAT